MNYENLITNILEHHDVPYWTEGKNVSTDSINIQCPFYTCNDHSNHMGIFKNSLLFNCWKCHKKGHFSYLLKVLTGKTEKECEEEINEEKLFLGLADKDEEDLTYKKNENISPLPKFFEKIEEKTNSPLLHKYLKRRKLDLNLIIKTGCGICRVGPYMNRMIIPVIFEGKQVSFVAADMTGTAKLKYIFPGTTKYLYGYDELKDDIIVVTEGVLDAWRVGEGVAVAMLGSYLTDHQKGLLIKKKPKNLIFGLDGDAYWHAKDIAYEFEPFVENVRVIHMAFEEDPDSLGTETIWNLIEEELFSEKENI